MKLYEGIGTAVFGSSRVVEIFGFSEVTATSYLKRMADDLRTIVRVEGMVKGSNMHIKYVNYMHIDLMLCI